MNRKIVILSILIFSGCHYFQKKAVNHCPGGGTPGNAPIVCIDAGLQPTPDPVVLKRGHTVQFFFTGGTDSLQIDSDVLENYGQNGGSAHGTAKMNASPGLHKYKITDLTTGRTNDPEVMIDPSP